MTRPHGITGSLTPTFVPARAVALAVRRPFAFALVVRLPTALRAPSRASVTLSEATAPVKLPASHGPRRCERPREIVNKTRGGFHAAAHNGAEDRKCTPLNSTHITISDAGVWWKNNKRQAECG